MVALVPIIIGIITQITKFVIFTFKHGLNWSYFLTHGHMPSTHSAFAASLIITVWYIDSAATASFVVALAISAMIIDDALRIRMYLGDQGRYLNMLVQTLNLDPKQYPRLKERIGHRNSEVIVGLIYGTLLTAALLKAINLFY